MLSPLRNRFGIPGVISVIALVFAMLGGAYAATNSGGGKATASAKGKPGPRGPRGKAGPAGPAGPVGPAGAQGPAGANGKDGANGANGKDGAAGTPGSPGAPGKSVTVMAANEVDECPDLGGAMVKVEGAGSGVEVCNGEKGEQGEEGSPWTAGGTLPPGAITTGGWAVTGDTGEEAATAISFPLPLSFFPEEENIHYLGLFESDPACPGINSEFPEALPGHLCVYQATASEATLKYIGSLSAFFSPVTSASRAGALLVFDMSGPGFASGSYAVTGCSEELPEGDPNKCP